MELLAGFNAAQIAVALLATFGAAFVRGLAGFGFAILLVPVLALAMTPVEAVLVTNVLAFLIGVSEIHKLVRGADREAWVICALVAVFTAPGLILLAITPNDLARLLIALVALSAFVAVLMPTGKSDSEPGMAVTGSVGASAGLLTGFAGMPGPPVVPFYVARRVERTIAKSSMLLIFTVAALAGIGSGVAIGEFRWSFIGLALLLFPALLIGNWVGSLAFGRVSDAAWRTFVAVVLGAAALAALIRLF